MPSTNPDTSHRTAVWTNRRPQSEAWHTVYGETDAQTGALRYYKRRNGMHHFDAGGLVPLTEAEALRLVAQGHL